MEIMDAWSVFLNTGNVLDYLRYSALKNSEEYFEDDKNSGNDSSAQENGLPPQALG